MVRIAAFPLAMIVAAGTAAAEPRLSPPAGTRVVPGQKFDVRVEDLPADTRPSIRVLIDGAIANSLEISAHGEGAGGHLDAVVRGIQLDQAGAHRLSATFGSGRSVEQTVVVEAVTAPPGVRGARNVIFVLGDGMGLAHRTGARVLARGYAAGRPRGPLAMDTMEATGLVMTSSLNALITDSAPGMSAYTTGNKANNNQMGVFPDDTPDAFDNPRVEYLGAWLRRRRGDGFNVGIVSTADLTDATPAACAVHTSNRKAGDAIARAFFDERAESGVTVMLGGGRKRFEPKARGGEQADRNVAAEFEGAGFSRADTATALAKVSADSTVKKVLGLFHPENMTTSFDKVGLAAGYSDELRAEAKARLRDQPSLSQMTRAALDVLDRTSPRGFFLMVEGASIDKRAHEQDAERALWDVIELDNAVADALAYAQRTNSNADPTDDTLVIVTADHETGGMGLVAVGNERYAPATLGKVVRDYAATLRFVDGNPERVPKPSRDEVVPAKPSLPRRDVDGNPERVPKPSRDEVVPAKPSLPRRDLKQVLSLFPNYQADGAGFPVDPDPSRKLIVGWAAGADRYENFTSNRLERPATIGPQKPPAAGVAVANPERDGPTSGPANDNQAVGGRPLPGFLVNGIIENGANHDAAAPGDTSSVPMTLANHTASDVPLSASGPGALTFTGTYDNTDTFFKMARILAAWRGKGATAPRAPSKK